MNSLIDQIKAAFLIAVFILTVSLPVLAEDDQAAMNFKKIESAKLLKEKTFTQEELAAGTAGMNGSGGTSSVVRLFQGLGICIAAFLVGIHIYKKYVLKDKANIQRTLRIIEKLPLSNKSQLCVVQYNEKRLLLAVGQDKVSFFQDSDILNSLGDYEELSGINQAGESCSEKVN